MEKAGLFESQTAEPTTITIFTGFLLHFGPKTGMGFVSLRRKRFRLVSEQRKTKERDSRLWPRER